MIYTFKGKIYGPLGTLERLGLSEFIKFTTHTKLTGAPGDPDEVFIKFIETRLR